MNIDNSARRTNTNMIILGQIALGMYLPRATDEKS